VKEKPRPSGSAKPSVETSYAVLIPSKNGEATIEQTLQSILSQTIPAGKIVAIDDASTDATPQILKRFSQVTTIRCEHKLPRDFARVPRLINLGLKRMSEPCSYVMISGDDSLYPNNYVQLVLEEFKKDPKLYVCSGSHTKQRILDEASPHGSGRVVRYSFLKKILPLPESIGWESWILFKAQQMGGRVSRVANVSYQHLRPYDSSSVWTFGQSMYELGYPFWFVLARTAKNIVLESNKLQQLTMPAGFLEFKLKRKSKLDIAEFVSRSQVHRIRRILRR
jgi:glycosyltransferase involved in cell wall biosynthesis